MPRITGQLTPEQEKQFQAWLAERMRNARCPVCFHNEWTAGEMIAAPFTDLQGKVDFRGGVPFLTLFCDHCGYAHLFSAIKVGITPATESGQQPPAGPGFERPRLQ